MTRCCDRARPHPGRRLLAEPRRFRFDAAVRVLTAARQDARIRRTPRASGPRPAWPIRPPTSLEVRPARPTLPPDGHRRHDGPHRPSGVLPRYYRSRHPDPARALAALHDFIDMLAHRFVAFFARGRRQISPGRTAETAAAARRRTRRIRSAQVLLALTGYGTPHLTARLAGGHRAAAALRRAVRHAAALGRAAGRHGVRLARHAGRGRAIRRRLAAAAARPAHPRWLVARRLEPARRRCGGRRAGLGPSGAHHPARRPAGSAGLRARCCRTGSRCTGWSRWCGPMSVSRLGLPSIRCSRRAEVPPLRLDAEADPPPRLGWNTWVPAPGQAATARAAMPPTRCSRLK